MQAHILSLTIFLPLVTAIYITWFVNNADILQAKYIAIFSSLLTLACSLFLLLNFNKEISDFQFVEHHSLIQNIGLEYHIGIDGISILFVVLTALLIPICIIGTINSITQRHKEYLVCFLLLESLVIAFFSSLNLLLFYIFFEAILIPMYLIIGCWGGEQRFYASMKFFIYTFFGSVMFLIALITIYVKIGSFDIPLLASTMKPLMQGLPHWVWIAIFIAMAVKVPMIPVHTWLPDAHVQAPTAGSVILAGILLKVGGYGMIRVLLELLPNSSAYFAPYVIYASLAAIIYAAFVAMAQTDMKKMIAYSSISHMGYVTAGIFTNTINGLEGAMFQMLSHGLVSSGLFLVVGMLYDRMHTKEIEAYGGVASRMPILATFFMILMLGSVGLPGTSGFVGEFLAIVGIFKYRIILSAFAALGIILGAIYMLGLYKKVMFGEITKPKVNEMRDLTFNEITALLPIVVLVIYLGIQPETLISIFRLKLEAINF